MKYVYTVIAPKTKVWIKIFCFLLFFNIVKNTDVLGNDFFEGAIKSLSMNTFRFTPWTSSIIVCKILYLACPGEGGGCLHIKISTPFRQLEIIHQIDFSTDGSCLH